MGANREAEARRGGEKQWSVGGTGLLLDLIGADEEREECIEAAATAVRVAAGQRCGSRRTASSSFLGEKATRVCRTTESAEEALWSALFQDVAC
jgi:hypothetical protein